MGPRTEPQGTPDDTGSSVGPSCFHSILLSDW